MHVINVRVHCTDIGERRTVFQENTKLFVSRFKNLELEIAISKGSVVSPLALTIFCFKSSVLSTLNHKFLT